MTSNTWAPLEELVPKVQLPSEWILEERSMCDMELLLNGGMAPLRGYMTLEEYVGCLERMCLPGGHPWTIPIILPIPLQLIKISDGQTNDQSIKLRDKTNTLVAELLVTSVFIPDLEFEKTVMFGEDHANHPYAKYMTTNFTNCAYVGGALNPKHPISHFDFTRYRLSPEQVKRRLFERGWSIVVGFQTRNPMHRSHYELTKKALRDVEQDMKQPARLMITPAVGPTQPGDVDYRVRVRVYEKILGHYEVEPLLCLLPITMRMAGPREAVWHAIIRRNYGCTHFIVGRDHAGPSSKRTDGSPFYGPYDAHELIQKFSGQLGIVPVLGTNMVYVEGAGYVQDGPRYEGRAQSISGTQFRSMLTKREPIPEWFCFKDVVAELHSAFPPLHKTGLCVYFTGLPCAGKSTLACALEAVLLETRAEDRKVTVLDADIIRTHLSKGLGFSREDRSLNVRRIGYVASEIVKHRGICLVANIAPYKEDRDYNRRLIESVGGHYVEIFVSTPLAICESRDIKELYKKARIGIIKQFTGISDPYEEPESPDLTINSSDDAMGKVHNIHEYLRSRQLCL